jgi:putative phosphoribosyl transferase
MRRRGAARVTVAVPVAPEDEFDSFRSVADEVVAVVTWPLFFGVGDAYDDFRQVSDEEVVSILRSARPGTPADR